MAHPLCYSSVSIIREQSRRVKLLPFSDSILEKIVSNESLNLISRQHFNVKSENGKFYICDNTSSNGTTINGTEIRGKGWQELRNGDRIIVAEVATLIFTLG